MTSSSRKAAPHGLLIANLLAQPAFGLLAMTIATFYAFLDGAPIVNLGQGLALCGALAQRALHKGQAL